MIRKALFSYRGLMSVILISGLVFAMCLGFAVAASAATLVIKGQTSDADGDGKVTLGEVFDYAGTSSGVVIAERKGPSVVLDAVRVQLLAQSLGLYWDNPRGLKRIIVTSNGAASPAVAAAPSNFVATSAAQMPQAQGTQTQTPQAPSPLMIRRGDVVSVIYRSHSLMLRASGVAQRDARLGERTTLINPTSKKPIEDVIVTGPGTAESGPLAQVPTAAIDAAPGFASR